MDIIEITGQACVGKTHFIQKSIDGKNMVNLVKYRRLEKVFAFVAGFKYLGPRRAAKLYFWSLNESAPYYFRLNIFINAVSKFGLKVGESGIKSSSQLIVFRDEGISHLPFLFLNTDTELVVDFLKSEINNIAMYFLRSPGCQVIQDRLGSRGHKRLEFMSITSFVQRNDEIEKTLLSVYPNLCKKMEIF